MASLVCTASTESSLSFRLEDIQTGQSYGNSRTFTFTCDGTSITKTVSATSTATHTGTAKFTGLDAGTEYTCVCSFTDSYRTYTWECDASTESSTTTTVTVQVLLDTEYVDYGECTKTIGDTPTVSNLMSSAGVTAPSSGEFDMAEDAYMQYNSLSDDVTIRANHVLNIYYLTPTPSTPVTVTSITIPSTVTVGESFTTSWTYSGDKDSSGSWQIVYTTTSTYSNPTDIFRNLSQSLSSKSGCTINTAGTFYVWVWYYGATQGSRVSICRSITVTAAPTGPQAYIYNGSTWKAATPYIYNGSTWVQATPNIYDGGWN